MDEKEEAIFIFKKLVFALYLEIASLQPSVHPEVAAKADLTHGFFKGEKQKQAVELYHMSLDETDPDRIVAPYKERTALSLEDIRRAFAEGNWRNKHGGYNFGGPKWLKIADSTLELRDLIKAQKWDEAAYLVYQTKKLKTNQGNLINMFEWTDRRKS